MPHVFIQHTVQDQVTLLDWQIKIFHNMLRQEHTNYIYIYIHTHCLLQKQLLMHYLQYILQMEQAS